MSRINFIQYQGKTILVEDFTKMKPCPEFFETIKEAQNTIAGQPPKSVLALLDATDVAFNAEVLSAMKDFVQANTPYIKCAAVVGIHGLLEIAVATLSKVAGRSFHSFSTRQEAMDFLITQ